jgi:hypothetical protein
MSTFTYAIPKFFSPGPFLELGKQRCIADAVLFGWWAIGVDGRGQTKELWAQYVEGGLTLLGHFAVPVSV